VLAASANRNLARPSESERQTVKDCRENDQSRSRVLRELLCVMGSAAGGAEDRNARSPAASSMVEAAIVAGAEIVDRPLG
jgi:hypothetical protein